MARLELKNVKVVSDAVWYDWESDTKIDIKEVAITSDTCGFYFFKPTTAEGKRAYTYRRSWAELSIKQLKSGLYEVKLWAVSSQYVRSESPFITLEMTREQLIEWHANDVWFEKELHYVVRRKGKKFTKDSGAVRCITCRYLVRDINDHNCKQDPYYLVDENMNTVKAERA